MGDVDDGSEELLLGPDEGSASVNSPDSYVDCYHNDLYIDGEDSVAEQELTQSNEMGFEQPTLMLSWDQIQSKIRLSQHLLSASERKKKVDAILLEFGLMKCADTKIGGPNSFKGISGGEMKRLSFATQMMENPDILFCDEPTSGLDSFMALNVVTVLKQMASMGRIVVLTIHQPSSKVFSLFDRILLLAEGRVGFMGSRLQAYKFFNEAGMQCPVNHNPADFYMQQLSTCSDEHHLQYATSKASGIPLHSVCIICDKVLFKNKTDYLRRICDMFDIKRSTYDGPENHKKLVISVVLGSLYFKQTLTQEGVLNINGALYLTLMCVTFQNLFGVITVFCSELPLFLREHSDKLYSNSAYFISKTFAELPIFIIQPFIIVTVVYFMIGYFVSSACSSTQMALTVSTPMIIPLLIFGGYFVKNNTASVYLGWIRYLSWFHHGFQALAINQWRNVDTI
ncbi:Protein white [Nymphon striatum]|nr:Protein white [Nymphon striatum]